MYRNSLSQQTRFVSIAFFSISLTQLCYCTQVSCEHSFSALFIGWAALYMGGPMLTWLANPMLLASWLTVKRYPYASLTFSIMAALASLSFLLFKTIYDLDGGWTCNITNYRLGYWLWLVSCWSMVTGNIILFRKTQNLT